MENKRAWRSPATQSPKSLRAIILHAQRLEGQRVLRGADFSKSDVDVILDLHPELKVDAKAYKRFAHHTLVREIQKRYSGNNRVK